MGFAALTVVNEALGGHCRGECLGRGHEGLVSYLPQRSPQMVFSSFFLPHLCHLCLHIPTGRWQSHLEPIAGTVAALGQTKGLESAWK